ncbi:hypothetical protein HDU80_004425 [Chytriomyces hyalinus]|nr:hypothetical protein HDU80_004425 [Chytriomyces hyalinus]
MSTLSHPLLSQQAHAMHQPIASNAPNLPQNHEPMSQAAFNHHFSFQQETTNSNLARPTPIASATIHQMQQSILQYQQKRQSPATPATSPKSQSLLSSSFGKAAPQISQMSFFSQQQQKHKPSAPSNASQQPQNMLLMLQQQQAQQQQFQHQHTIQNQQLQQQGHQQLVSVNELNQIKIQLLQQQMQIGQLCEQNRQLSMQMAQLLMLQDQTSPTVFSLPSPKLPTSAQTPCQASQAATPQPLTQTSSINSPESRNGSTEDQTRLLKRARIDSNIDDIFANLI